MLNYKYKCSGWFCSSLAISPFLYIHLQLWSLWEASTQRIPWKICSLWHKAWCHFFLAFHKPLVFKVLEYINISYDFFIYYSWDTEFFQLYTRFHSLCLVSFISSVNRVVFKYITLRTHIKITVKSLISNLVMSVLESKCLLPFTVQNFYIVESILYYTCWQNFGESFSFS